MAEIPRHTEGQVPYQRHIILYNNYIECKEIHRPSFIFQLQLDPEHVEHWVQW